MVSLVLISMPACKHQRSPARPINNKVRSQIRAFSALNADVAALVQERTRELRITTNAGLSWEVVTTAAVGDAFETAILLDEKLGWALNHRGELFKSNSGGISWTKISALTEFTCANQIQFANGNDGWILECLSIWRTRDAGVTWQKKLSTSTPGVTGPPGGMFVIDSNTVAVSGTGGQVYLSKDGGETWNIKTPIAGDNIDFSDVWFVNPEHGWVTGTQIIVAGESSRPLLLETTDGGETWKEIIIGADVMPSSICFVGDDGWLAGVRRVVSGESVDLRGVLLTTKDAGKHWIPIQFPPNEPVFTEVRFADKTHGWLVGRDTLYRTVDGGRTWQPVLALPAIN